MEATPTAPGEIYRAHLIQLMDDWYEQVKEFRRLSLETNDPVERTRMRAKADTLRYRQAEIMNLVEEMDEMPSADDSDSC